MNTEEWKQAEKALSSMEVMKQGTNDPVTIEGESNDLHCIGIGTDAAVFVYEPLPHYAYKLYAAEALPKRKPKFACTALCKEALISLRFTVRESVMWRSAGRAG